MGCLASRTERHKPFEAGRLIISMLVLYLVVPFKIAFGQPPVDHSSPPVPSSETIDLTPHLVQVSLPGDSSPETAEKFGEVLGKLRQDGWGIVCTGQAVHNLRDLRESGHT